MSNKTEKKINIALASALTITAGLILLGGCKDISKIDNCHKENIVNVLNCETNTTIDNNVTSRDSITLESKKQGNDYILVFNYFDSNTILDTDVDYKIIYEVNNEYFNIFENFNNSSCLEKLNLISLLAQNYEPTEIKHYGNNNNLTF